MLISRITKSIGQSAGDRRIAARMTLAFIASVLCLMLALAGTSLGRTGAFVAAQPSPSGSPSGPVGKPGEIFLLNPNATYDPAFAVREPPGDPRTPDPPKISDEFDGVDEAYHVVAVVKDPPPDAFIEAYYTPNGGNEITAGQLSPVPGSDDTFELFWDISESAVPGSFGTFAVRLFEQTPTGFEEVSSDEVPVRMQHMNTPNTVSGSGEVTPAVPEAETVELLWPTQNGPLGFHKGAGAGSVWQTVVDGVVSQGDPGTSPDPTVPPEGERLTYQVRAFYSVSPIGTTPKYQSCTTGISTGASRPNGTRPFSGTCTLNGTDRPSQVTALAAVAVQDQDPDRAAGDTNTRQPTQESADAHRVFGFHQRVEDMKLDLSTTTGGADHSSRRHIVQGSSASTCLAYRLTVTDALDRPVQGANVDVHLSGPGDQVQFGDEATANPDGSSLKQKPQKDHSTEVGRDCDANGNFAELTQGDHNIPGANDLKHLESVPTGTGRSGGNGTSFGQWQFFMWSPSVGDTEITAWVDDEPVVSDSEKREADDDVFEPSEASDTNFAQWLPSAITVTLDPLGATAASGTCQRFIVRARAGVRPVRSANIDVHATGPSNDLDFCDPGDGSLLEAPTLGAGHNAEDTREVIHAGQPPAAQHTEGQTNDAGNLVIGINSPVPGDTTLTAWYDAGEAGFDNDVQDAGEANGSATTNWVESTGDAAISFLNPSPYGGAGTNVARTQDVDAAYHIVSRVSSIPEIPGVEFFYRSGSGPLVKIADGTRIGQTDSWEAFWPVDVADGPYTLVARIRDSAIVAEQSVTVRNQGSMVDPTVVPFQTAEITAPLDGQRATFTNRRLTVRGVASAGAEGVHVYYTKAGSLATPGSTAWTQCATSTLPSGSNPKEFALECVLTGSDQPGLVTGIAAIAYNCIQNCTASQTNHSGDAHRVFGVDTNPLLAMEPAETAADAGPCVKFVVSLTDQTGQPIPGQNLDVHMTGPGNSGNFCAPEDGSGTAHRAPNDGGHTADGNETDEAYHEEAGGRVQHTEAETTGNGRLVFGIESETAGDAQLTVWLDANDDDVLGGDETRDISIMHWEDESACDITGTDGPDVLEGTSASERICGFGGNDTIGGGGGDDVISGGAGADLLRGNAGNDRMGGGAGRDKVFGGGGSDRAFGGGGPDVVKGHRSNDNLSGNRGNDRLDGGVGRDGCAGGPGRDRLSRCESGSRSFAARTRPI